MEDMSAVPSQASTEVRGTPETDAFAHAKYVSSMYAAASGSAPGIFGTEQSPEEAYGDAVEFARKLERQRNALAEALRDARGFVLLHSKGIAVQEGGLLAQIDAALSSL